MIVKNGLVAFSGEDEFLSKDLRIQNGRIVAIGRNLESGTTDEVLDASDCRVLPGAVDPHVHFYDPGYTEKEDFAHGSAAAASGGVTTVIDMPCTSLPPVTDTASLHNKLAAVSPKSHIDFGFFGGVSRQLFDAGCREAMASIADQVMGFKVYAVSGMEEVWGALDHWRFHKVLELAGELGSIVLLHAEDAEYVVNASQALQKTCNDPEAWYRARPELAEVMAVQNALRIASEAGGNLHIVHIGTAEAARMLKNPLPEGCRVSGETCPQYLAFTTDDFIAQGAVLKIAPPIKKEGNRDELWSLLKDGTIEFVASDHAPGTAQEKSGNDIWKNSAGIAGTGTILPYLFSEGYFAGRLPLSRLLEVVSEAAAKRYGFFNRKGSIEVGKDADLVLINTNENWTVRGSDFFSKGKLSPFEGRIFTGRVEKTLVRGRVVYDRRRGALEPGWGEFIRPARSV
jgi:allantoinase